MDKREAKREVKRVELEQAARVRGAKAAVKQSNREWRAKHRACFWTWPWGHVWSGYRGGMCKVCGRQRGQ